MRQPQLIDHVDNGANPNTRRRCLGKDGKGIRDDLLAKNADVLVTMDGERRELRDAGLFARDG